MSSNSSLTVTRSFANICYNSENYLGLEHDFKDNYGRIGGWLSINLSPSNMCPKLFSSKDETKIGYFVFKWRTGHFKAVF